MAIVEKSTKSNPKQWEEFAVLRLSKRELAGIAALIGPTVSGSILPYKLYNEIDKLLDGNATAIPMYDGNYRVMEFLNDKYGEI